MQESADIDIVDFIIPSKIEGHRKQPDQAKKHSLTTLLEKCSELQVTDIYYSSTSDIVVTAEIGEIQPDVRQNLIREVVNLGCQIQGPAFVLETA